MCILSMPWPWLLTSLLALVGSPAAVPPTAPVRPAARPAATTVYVVRHAEKDTAASRADPPLSAAGLVRAEALRRVLARRHPAALFTTDTRRTRATLAPLAAATGLAPQVYDARQPAALAQRIRQDYVGRAVVVVGHSNTLLPLIAALGGTPPVQAIGDNDYDYLFTVLLRAGRPPAVAVRRYGAVHPAAPGPAPRQMR